MKAFWVLAFCACSVRVDDFRGGAAPEISEFSATPNLITDGQSVVLHAVFSNGLAVVDNGVGAVVSGRDVTVIPAANGGLAQARYTLTVSSGGNPIAQTLVVQVAAAPPTPTIVAPASAAAGAVHLVASVTPTPGISYHWTIENGALESDVGSDITFASAQSGDLALSVQATNAAGASVSATATVRVLGLSVLSGALGIDGSSDGDALASSLTQPFGIALAADHRVYVADTGNHTIRRWDRATALLTTIAGTAGTSGDTTTSLFNQPRGLAFDATGTLFVADSGNDAVRTLAADGTVATVSSSVPLYEPNSLAVDSNGRIFVAAADAAGAGGHGRVVCIDHGTSTVIATGFQYNGDVASFGLSVALGPNDTVLVIADNRLDQLTPNGALYTKTTIAGGGNDASDGAPATQAQLFGLVGVAIDDSSAPLILSHSAFYSLMLAHVITAYVAPSSANSLLTFNAMALDGGDVYATTSIPGSNSRLVRVRLR